MNPALILPAPATVANDPVNKAGFFLLSLYFFINYSRILDMTAPGLHLPLIIGLCLYAAAALAGSIQRSLATAGGKLLIALTGLMVLASLFGAWKGGSVGILVDYWFKAFPFYFTVIGLCVTTDQLFRFLRTICIAVTFLALVALWRGDSVMGRLIVDNSRFSDPNDLALVCLIVVPLCCFLVARRQKTFVRIAGLIMICPLLYAFARTGSRGGAIGLALGLIYVFWKATVKTKFIMVIGSAVIVVVAAAVLPPEVYLRYTGLVGESEEAADVHELRAAEGSAEARMRLLKQSIAITLENPLLGVGPGNFAVVDNEKAIEAGFARGSWHVTHNMYTQISSENGIPAMLLFIGILVLAIRATKRTLLIAKYHPDEDTVSKAAFWLRVSILGYSGTGFFLSIAYTDMLPLMSGLAVALELAVMNEIRSAYAVRPVASVPAAPTLAYAGSRR